MDKKTMNFLIIVAGAVVLVIAGVVIFSNSDASITAEVTGIDNLSETPQETGAGEPELPATLELLEFDCAHFRYSEMLGYQARYSGEIANIGSALEQYVKVHITFFTNREIVGTVSKNIDSVSLRPGETSGFEGDIKNLPSEMDYCEIRVTSY